MRVHLCVLLLSCCAALKVLAPQSLKGDIKHVPASFGNAQFGGSITGQLFYWKANHYGCQPLDRSLIPESHRGRTIIIMVDRGNCTFVQKVRDAEDIAANGVVIVNTDDNLITMADDGTGRNIGIPSVLITKTEGARLEAEVNSGKKLMVELSWDMPHPDNHVEWELWTSANDPNAANFISEFAQATTALGSSVTFTPEYGILDGNWYGCTKDEEKVGGLPCGKQCTNHGRYCAEDPEHDIEHGADGMSVVQENLRQMCVFQVANATRQQSLWWTYVTEFKSKCTAKGHLTETCSVATMKSVGVNEVAVAKCVKDSGGSGYDGDSQANTLFEQQLDRMDKAGIAVLPTIRINGKVYQGKVDCPKPISLGTCPVLVAICSGFEVGAAPAVCRTDYCWEKAGVDACGVCGGDGKSCMGCDGVPNSGKELDACSVCGGTGSFDKCGMCLQADQPYRDRMCAGCDGLPNSGKVKDACGVCGGDGSTDLCGNCFPKDSPMRNKACTDTISLSLELAGIDAAGVLRMEREVEAGIAALLAPNVTGAEDVRITAIIAHHVGGGSSTINITNGAVPSHLHNDTNIDRVTLKLEIGAHPGTGQDTSRNFEASVQNGAFDREMAARKVAVKADMHDHLPAPIVRAGTPTGSISYVPSPIPDSKPAGNSLASAQIAGIAVGGIAALAMFGVGVRHFVVAREKRVRMDMRDLISDMGRPMQEVGNPAQGANVDFSSL